MPADAAGLVRFRHRGRGVARRAAKRRHDHIAGDVPRVAVLQMLLSNMDMVLAKSDIAIASRYAELVSDTALRHRVFSRLRAEFQSTVDALLRIIEQASLLESNPLLARSIRNRFPYLDPLNHMQIELLKRYRAGDPNEDVVTGIHLTINGLAAGLRNSG